MKFRIKYADRIVGLFVVAAALVLVTLVVLLGANQRWFARDFAYRTVFASAGGVSPGSPILMRGFQVGKITGVSLTGENSVEARFVIYDTYVDRVRENSLVELVTSPIGLGTQILFHPGRGEEAVAEGSLVPAADSLEGQAIVEQELADIPPKDDSVSRLLAGINPLIENLNRTVVTVNRTLTEVNRSLAGQSSGPLGGIIEGAEAAVASANALVADADGSLRVLSAKADTLVGNLNAITANLAETTAALRDPTGLVPRLLDPKGSLKTFLDDNNALYNRVNGAVGDIEKTLRNFQAMSASLNAQMPSIAAALEETRTAIKQAQGVLEGLKNNPLLRGGVPEREEQRALYQGLREGEF